MRFQRTLTAFRALPGIVRFGLCLALAIVAMLLVPAPAKAEDQIAKQGENSVTISESPCTHAGVLIELDKIAPGKRDQYRRAIAQWQGQMYYACWTLGPGAAYLVYEDGDQGMVPLKDFKPVMAI